MDTFRIQTIDAASLRRERTRVLHTLARVLPAAEALEVGSTAVDGVIGKGDLDVLVRVPEGDFPAARAALDGCFRRNPDQLANALYQGYTVDSALDVAVQLTVKGGPYDDFERFLEALRADPALVDRYNALKRAWHGRPMDAYRAAKAAFIEAVLAG